METPGPLGANCRAQGAQSYSDVIKATGWALRSKQGGRAGQYKPPFARHFLLCLITFAVWL